MAHCVSHRHGSSGWDDVKFGEGGQPMSGMCPIPVPTLKTSSPCTAPGIHMEGADIANGHGNAIHILCPVREIPREL